MQFSVAFRFSKDSFFQFHGPLTQKICKAIMIILEIYTQLNVVWYLERFGLRYKEKFLVDKLSQFLKLTGTGLAKVFQKNPIITFLSEMKHLKLNLDVGIDWEENFYENYEIGICSDPCRQIVIYITTDLNFASFLLFKTFLFLLNDCIFNSL